jgi:ubiquinone/menaquinone biosynthesis C-methylase UbiE
MTGTIGQILDILRSPDSGKELKYDSQSLVDISNGQEFLIEDGIALLYPVSYQSNQFGMDYLQHYKNDAVLFNYFEKRECAATEHDERRLREYISSLSIENGEYLLDAGAGSGWVAKKFLNKFSKIISFDISIENVAGIDKSIGSKNHYPIAGDLLHAPFKAEAFDQIILSEVIEHIVDPIALVMEMSRILKPGGRLIISTPYKEQIHYSQCIHCNRLTPRNAHLHSFDEAILISIFDQAGLTIPKYYIFGNKALHLLRTSIILKFFPFSVWKLIDRISSFILPKMEHIILVYDKPKQQ